MHYAQIQLMLDEVEIVVIFIESVFNEFIGLGSRYRSRSGGSCDGDDEECMYIGIGVGCGVFVLIVVVLIITCCCKNKLKIPNCCKPSQSSSKVNTSEINDYFMEKY